jgi:hypothetical protein
MYVDKKKCSYLDKRISQLKFHKFLFRIYQFSRKYLNLNKKGVPELNMICFKRVF